MFTVYCDGHLLFDLKKHIVLTNPTLQMADNSSGSLEFDIDPNHPMYDKIESMVSEIVVKQDGEEIWAGRATEQKTNFFGMKSVYCEGELAYLCDTIQEPSESHYEETDNVRHWLNDRLVAHNAKAPNGKKFEVGVVTVRDPDILYRYTNYETTLECILDKLVNVLGGHLRIRKENGVRYLDYLAEYPGSAQQSIRFGLNLLEYSRTLTRADIATVCVPLGARLEEKDFDALDKYLDVSSVNGGSIYVESTEGVNAFGRIIKVVHWDDVYEPENLLTKAKDWINNVQYDDLKLEVNALDFHLADGAVPAIHMLDEVRVVSPPHGMDRWYPVTQLNIPLDNPAQMVFTLGTSERVSLTTKTNRAISSITDDLEVMPSAVLQQAKDNATELIKTGALGGNVVVLPNEIYISDSPDIGSAKNMWRWNSAGLGYTKDSGKNYGLAITMDGAIVADYITAGKLSGDRIYGGAIKLGGTAYGNGKLIVYNSKGDEIGHWDYNGIEVKSGKILGGTINGAKIQAGGNNNQEGTITVHDATGKQTIGKWDKDGIDVTSGTIHGAAVTVGGAGNANGSITVQDGKGNTIGTWDNSGILVKSGSITGGTINGAKITVGGKGNGSGSIFINDDVGKQCGKWDKDGITIQSGEIHGATISGNAISGGTIKGTTISGTTISGGSITGTTINAGGKDNKSGTINVYGEDGKTKYAVLSKAGLTLSKGSIKGTSIALGGKDDPGSMTIKDGNGTEIGKWNKDGITIKKGSIAIGSNFKVTSSGILNAVNGTFKGTITGSTITGSTISGGSIHGGYYTGADNYGYEPEVRMNLSNEKVNSSSSSTDFYTGMRVYNVERASYGIYIYPAKQSTDGSPVQWAPTRPRILTKSIGLEIIGHGNVNGTAGAKLNLDSTVFSLGYGNTAIPSITGRTSSGGSLEMYGGNKFDLTAHEIILETYAGNNESIKLNPSGKLYYSGTEVAKVSSSSIRYKHGIKALSEDRNPHRLYTLPIKEFEWNDDHPLQYKDMRGKTIPGIIAEDVEKIYPSAVIHDEKGQVESWDERRLVPGMLALIQEQHQRLCALERRLA